MILAMEDFPILEPPLSNTVYGARLRSPAAAVMRKSFLAALILSNNGATRFLESADLEKAAISSPVLMRSSRVFKNRGRVQPIASRLEVYLAVSRISYDSSAHLPYERDECKKGLSDLSFQHCTARSTTNLTRSMTEAMKSTLVATALVASVRMEIHSFTWSETPFSRAHLLLRTQASVSRRVCPQTDEVQPPNWRSKRERSSAWCSWYQ